MTTPTNDMVREAYSRWGRNHAELREQFTAALETLGPTHEHAKRWPRVLAMAAAAALAAVAVTGSYLATRPTPAYGIEAVRERLLSLHSLYLKGKIYQRETTEFGVATVAFPFERYYERPGTYYATHYGFSCQSDDDLTAVSLVTTASDAERVMVIDHQNKKCMTGRQDDPLQCELMVETGLQISEIEQLLGGPPADYQRVGEELVAGAWCDMFEVVLHDAGTGFSKRVWIERESKLPVRVVLSSTTPDGEPDVIADYDEILVDAPRPERLFTFAAPEGYELVSAPESAEKIERQPVGERPLGNTTGGSAGELHISLWTGVNLDDRAVLACWSFWTEDQDDKKWFAGAPRIELKGADAARPCDEQTLWETQLGGTLWRWSLFAPVDGRPLAEDKLVLRAVGVKRDTMTLTVPALSFPESRLAGLVEELQRRTLGPDAANDEVRTLEQLRRQIAEAK